MNIAQIKGERGKAAKPEGTPNPDKKYKPGKTPGTRVFTDPHSGKGTVKPWPEDPRLGGSNFTVGDALKGAAVVVVVGGVALLLTPEVAAALAAAGLVTALSN